MIAELDHSSTNSWFVKNLASRNVTVDPGDVVADLKAMEAAFPNAAMHRQAMDEMLHQIDVIMHRHPGKPLRGRLQGWTRHKFLSNPSQRNVHADLRIVYRTDRGSLEIFGFGHRRTPQDIYLRLSSRALQP